MTIDEAFGELKGSIPHDAEFKELSDRKAASAAEARRLAEERDDDDDADEGN